MSEARIEHARAVLRGLATEDPTPVHFKMARKIAKDNGWNWQYTGLGDRFARVLCTACNRLAGAFNFDGCDDICRPAFSPHGELVADQRLDCGSDDGRFARVAAWDASEKTKADEDALWSEWKTDEDGTPAFLSKFARMVWARDFLPGFQANDLHWRETTEAFETVLDFIAKRFSININVTCGHD